MAANALLPRESGEFIVKNAKYIKVKEEGINTLAQEIIKGIQEKRIDVNNFSQHDLHPKPTDDFAVEWIFVVDTLNFCFWTPSKLIIFIYTNTLYKFYGLFISFNKLNLFFFN